MFSKIIPVAFFTLLVIVLAKPIAKQSTSEMLLPFAERQSVPLHGNWCGPNRGRNSNTPCVDDLDCKCKQHNLCWKKYGTLNCKCDADLLKSLAGTTSPIGVAIKAYFLVSPCIGPVRFPLPKACKKCIRIFKKRICTIVPCGFKNVCEMIPRLTGKKLIKTYVC